ncbi:MAG: RloB family protein [Oscillospiraceae bacterium]
MARIERNGKRKTREQLAKQRVPELGYYFIVTDTKETEQNYMYGLRNAIPKELQGKLVIKVIKTKTKNLVNEAINLASLNPQYGETWIIFDRDQVQGFDEIIRKAEDKGINVGWSNPCIEAWFNAYFGVMPTYHDSVSCCNGFEKAFEQASGHKYIKSDSDIYEKLNRFGDEEKAIKLAQQKLEEHKANCKDKPSEMCPCTTVHCLVKEIKSKITKEK